MFRYLIYSLSALGFLGLAPHVRAQDGDLQSFKAMAEVAIQVISPFGGDAVVPGLEVFDLPLETREKIDLKCFPDRLRSALESDNPKLRAIGEKYLYQLATVIRWNDLERDRDDQFRFALGEHAGPIARSLKKNIASPKAKNNLRRATVLLAIEPEDHAAIEIVNAALKDKEPVRRRKACEHVAALRLAHDEIVVALTDAVKVDHVKVREAAVEAIWKIGFRGRKAVPALIEVLKTRKPVYDAVFPYEFPRDIGLLALVEMKGHARPAVPVIAKSLINADYDARMEVYRCLGNLGPHAKAAIPDLERSLTHKQFEDCVVSAAALLCIDNSHAKAGDVLLAALTSNDKDSRRVSLEVCRDFAPKTKALVKPLTAALLNRRDPFGQFNAAVALGNMGVVAESAIPSLKEVATQKPGRVSCGQAEAAANALGRIGKAGMPALDRLLQNEDWLVRSSAIMALAEMDSTIAKVIPLLTSALQDADIRLHAACSLGMHRKNAASAKASLTHLVRDDPDLQVRIMASWALTQLEREPRENKRQE